MPRLSLRTGLDRDVYQLVRKLEDELDLDSEPGKGSRPRLTVASVYDYIRGSNSSLRRQKRKPLEDSIERALKFRKQDLEDQESEAEEEEASGKSAQDTPSAPPTDSSLLNRQLARRWKLAEKKEKGQETKEQDKGDKGDKTDKTDHSEGADKMNGTKKRRRSRSPSATARTRTTDGEQNPAEAPSKLLMPKRVKTNKGYTIADLKGLPNLGGIDGVVHDFEVDVWPQMVPREEVTMAEDGDVIMDNRPANSVPPSVLFPGRSGVDCLVLETSDRVEKSLSDVFDEATGMAPCIVQIHRLDRLWQAPGASQSPPNAAAAHMEQFLRRLTTVKRQGQRIAVAATTTRPETIPGEFHKYGLLEDKYSIKAPTEQARKEILEAIGREHGDPLLDYTMIARRTHGYVGDDLRLVALKSRNFAYSANRPVALEDFERAISVFTPHLYREGFTAIPDVTLDQVGGLRNVISLLELNIINRIKHPELYESVSKPAGVLLWGPPGCGKTFVAQAIANAAQASFILVNGPELLDKYVGESERKIRALFDRARTCAPCLVFLDEIDSLVPRRENTSTEAGTRVVNTFLTELDGARGRAGVYVVAATNRPDMIDPAMFRTGRFNRKVYVDLPSDAERLDILKTMARSRRLGSDPNVVEAVARDARCGHFSGADLSELMDRAVLEAVQRAVRGGPTTTARANVAPSEDDWEVALKGLKPSVANIELYRAMALAEEMTEV
ncbi:unnamed protein product [Parascedosporium putredinis]|uniref:AAA+ ATPase domain-containing protein n=1 Tax=Parascedosporium putredinis TaxID=1442378 RepID=A0A9P1H844_9PEZI|nr:unnamed protein product [Parascedosporium putredinis]CAI7999509.1 unnamed protein product [Parascedosporium putredinis]